LESDTNIIAIRILQASPGIQILPI